MKKKGILTITALLLSLMVSIGFAAAYFTDYEAAKGGAVIHLGGQTELTEDVDKDGNKTLQVQNTGQTDMIVRVLIYGDKDRIDSISADGWNKGDDGAYYYSKVLHPAPAGSDQKGDVTSTLKVNVKTDKGVSDTDDFQIIVVHEGSQAVYDGAGDPGSEGQKLKAPDGWDKGAVAKIKTK